LLKAKAILEELKTFLYGKINKQEENKKEMLKP
jgi:hypothetical protein